MKRRRFLPTLLLMWVGVLVVLLASLCLGRYTITPQTVLRVLVSRFVPIARTWDPTVDTVVWQVRLPRALAAAVVGAALASGGAVFQGLFHNPLVSPYVLGVSSGAGFGAAVAILLGASAAVTQASAFATGAVAVSLTWLIARSGRDRSHVTLVLAGFVVGSLFSSLVAGAQYVADPSTKLPQIVFWLMGSLASVQWTYLLRAAVVIVPCLLAIIALRWKLNILSMGDDEARSLGENPGAMRVVLIGLTTMTTAVSVALSGVIGWVGLVVPHLARGIVGPDSRRLIPASIALGAIYMMIIDDVARTLTMAEIPLGILTGIAGAPVFALLLRRSRSDWDYSACCSCLTTADNAFLRSTSSPSTIRTETPVTVRHSCISCHVAVTFSSRTGTVRVGRCSFVRQSSREGSSTTMSSPGAGGLSTRGASWFGKTVASTMTQLPARARSRARASWWGRITAYSSTSLPIHLLRSCASTSWNRSSTCRRTEPTSARWTSAANVDLPAARGPVIRVTCVLIQSVYETEAGSQRLLS